MFKMSIPEISDEELMERYKHIKPVITAKDGKLHYFREYTLDELRRTSYFFNRDEDMREEVGENQLEAWSACDFPCLHTYAYCGFFKPSIAEVLAQVDEGRIPLIKAFEIIDYPKYTKDFRKDILTSIAFDNGYHVSTVRLYTAKRDARHHVSAALSDTDPN